jgi:hypothetical protein
VAATILDASRLIFHIAGPVNTLLDGEGLRRGLVLELSGPPGSPKEKVALEAAENALDSGTEIVFLGRYYDII